MIRMCTYSSILGAKVSLMHNEDITKQTKTLISIKYRLQILLLIYRKLKRIIQLLFLLKSENLWFCDSIRENRCELIHLKFTQKQKRELKAIAKILALHCVKIVGIRSFLGPSFPAFRLNTERYGASLRIQSECRKTRTRKTPNRNTFHTVLFASSSFFHAFVGKDS